MIFFDVHLPFDVFSLIVCTTLLARYLYVGKLIGNFFFQFFYRYVESLLIDYSSIQYPISSHFWKSVAVDFLTTSNKSMLTRSLIRSTCPSISRVYFVRHQI